MARRPASPIAVVRDEAIRLGGDPQAAGPARWGFVLVVFMRIVAVLWLAQGLLQWTVIMGVADTRFAEMSQSSGLATALFAVLDLVAAVGLWFAAPWGAVLWVLTLAAQMATAVLLPGFSEAGPAILAADSVLVVTYFLLTWQAARHRA